MDSEHAFHWLLLNCLPTCFHQSTLLLATYKNFFSPHAHQCMVLLDVSVVLIWWCKMESHCCFPYPHGMCCNACHRDLVRGFGEDYVPTTKMAPGSLGPNDNLMAELERISLKICCSWWMSSLHTSCLFQNPLLNLRPCVWSKLMEPGYPRLFTRERSEVKWPQWTCQTSGSCLCLEGHSVSNPFISM